MRAVAHLKAILISVHWDEGTPFRLFEILDFDFGSVIVGCRSVSGIRRFAVFRLFGPFPTAIPKGMPARLELGCTGMMALLRLAVPWLFDSSCLPDLVRLVFVGAGRLPR